MFCNKSDHKKYGFVLVLYLFRDISSLKSQKGENIKFSRTGFLYKQKIQILVPLNCKRFILKRKAKFWFSYRSDHNAIVF